VSHKRRGGEEKNGGRVKIGQEVDRGGMQEERGGGRGRVWADKRGRRKRE